MKGDEEHSRALRSGARKTQDQMHLFFSEVAKELAHKHTIDIDRPEVFNHYLFILFKYFTKECTFVMAKSLVIGQLFDYKPLRQWNCLLYNYNNN